MYAVRNYGIVLKHKFLVFFVVVMYLYMCKYNILYNFMNVYLFNHEQ